MPAPVISICVVASRQPMLDDCLVSLYAQEDPPDFELLVSIGDDPAMAAAVRRRFPDVRICQVSGSQYPGAARNDLVQRAAGELLLFVDDDVIAHPRLLRRLADLARDRPEASVFGGPNETPPASSRFQFVQGAVLASLVGSGPVRRRYGAHRAGVADERWFILCNLTVRRQAMLPFPEDIICAEENALLTELQRRGAQMHYSPTLIVYHERRSDSRSFARQIFKYGRGRGALLRRSPRATRAAFVAPSTLCLYALALPALVAYLGGLSVVGLAAYGCLVAAASCRIGLTLRRIRAVPTAALLIVILHLSYGSGVIQGLLAPRAARLKPTARWEDHAPRVPAFTHDPS